MTDTAPAAAAYPLPHPDSPDPRFIYRLLFDIAEVLPRNGFPRAGGTDWAQLMTTLHRFLYQPQETP